MATAAARDPYTTYRKISEITRIPALLCICLGSLIAFALAWMVIGTAAYDVNMGGTTFFWWLRFGLAVLEVICLVTMINDEVGLAGITVMMVIISGLAWGMATYVTYAYPADIRVPAGTIQRLVDGTVRYPGQTFRRGYWYQVTKDTLPTEGTVTIKLEAPETTDKTHASVTRTTSIDLLVAFQPGKAFEEQVAAGGAEASQISQHLVDEASKALQPEFENISAQVPDPIAVDKRARPPLPWIRSVVVKSMDVSYEVVKDKPKE